MSRYGLSTVHFEIMDTWGNGTHYFLYCSVKLLQLYKNVTVLMAFTGTCCTVVVNIHTLLSLLPYLWISTLPFYLGVMCYLVMFYLESWDRWHLSVWRTQCSTALTCSYLLIRYIIVTLTPFDIWFCLWHDVCNFAIKGSLVCPLLHLTFMLSSCRKYTYNFSLLTIPNWNKVNFLHPGFLG